MRIRELRLKFHDATSTAHGRSFMPDKYVLPIDDIFCLGTEDNFSVQSTPKASNIEHQALPNNEV